MILNRLDRGEEDGAGVGQSLLNLSSHEPGEIGLIADIAVQRRRLAGDGVVVLDVGANIGTHTVAWARWMTGWGSVMAFEPQERTFYALAGNIAINNCFNASASMTAVSSSTGRMPMPRLDPQQPANFGGLSLKPEHNKQGPGLGNVMVPTIAIDDLKLPRLDILKLDIEGMEPEAIDGAANTIRKLRPVVFAEHATCGNIAIATRLPGYRLISCGMSVLAVHQDDPLEKLLRVVGDGLISLEEAA